MLARRVRNRDVAECTAAAIVREARRLRLSPSLIAGVVLIENRPLDTAAVSSQGAVGLMQVMPFHAGGWGCATSELAEIEANICHGIRLLHAYLKRSRTVEAALRRYNGCVKGISCRRYPARVLQIASRIRREMLAVAPTAVPRQARAVEVRWSGGNTPPAGAS